MKKKKKEIDITIKRFTCTSEEYDYTCIEIMKNDNLLNEKCDNYFEIDDNIYTDDPNEQYKDQEIIMMQYAGLNKLSFSNGKVEQIKNYQIEHSISKDHGSSGSLIIVNSHKLKIIGIHCGKTKKNFNRGNFMKVILDDIQTQFSRNLI